MESHLNRAAVISLDDALRGLLRDVMRTPSRGVELSLEISVPFTALNDQQLQALRQADPEIIFLDLESDPALGLKFAQFLADQAPHRRIIAAGPMLSQEQLLAALRAGVSEYLPKPVTPEAAEGALSGALRRIRWSPNNVGAAEPGRLLAIFSPKGGSGATTLAINLAIHLHRLTGGRTLLVDLDLELGEIALQLNLEPRFHFVDLIRNFHRMDADLLASFIERHDSGVHVLSAPYHPQKAEMATAEGIAKILRFLKRHYDHVIIDTSKSFSPQTLSALEQADQVYLVTPADLPSLRNIARCLPLLRQISGSDEGLRLVLNRHQDEDLIGADDIERTLNLPVYARIGNDYEAVMRSINSGVPVILSGTSRYAEDVRALAARVAGLSTAESRDTSQLRRWSEPITRLWRRALTGDAEVRQ